MDQNSDGNTDKRNWRERLGIGTKDVPAKDMPRIAEDFKPAQVAAKPAAAPASVGVRPAPMAPRVATRVVAPAPSAPIVAAAPRPPVVAQPRPPALAPDALANKLKSQRDAAEKLAEQRVLAARQRAEAALVSPPQMPGAAKPKFSFADEENKAAKTAATQPNNTRPPALPPQGTARPAVSPPQGQSQMAPPRPALGSNMAVPPRSPLPQAYPQGQPYGQQPPPAYVPSYAPQPAQNYAPPPAYRPIDPATGYAPPPPFNPAPTFNPPPREPYGAPATQQPQPRLQMPQRAPQPDAGFDSQSRPTARTPNAGVARAPVPAAYNQADGDDIFEQPAPVRSPRRATANDYQQAYREVESGFEDDAPRSRVPWILASLLALVLAIFGGFWVYSNYVKPQLVGSASQSVPVVNAPETPTKIVPDATTDAKPVTPGAAVQPTKKQIYDRIIGDREVLGGQIVPTEVTPVPPADNGQAAPAAAAPDPAQPATGTGNDGTPLPLPPPPGATNGTQGSLEPSAKGDQQLATITPAAGASPAADSSQVVPVAPVPGEVATSSTAVVAGQPQASAPVAQTTAPAISTPAQRSQVEKAATAETIQDPPQGAAQAPADAAAAVEKKIKAVPVKKPVLRTEKSLGSRPVVLVPPVKKPLVVADATTTAKVAGSGGDGLYGDKAIGESAVASANTAPSAISDPTVKKRRTLLDLFKKNDPADASIAPINADVPAAPAAPAPVKVATIEPPAVVQQSSPTGAYVAQLASFKSKAEASQEYNRMRAKHGAIVGRYAPIVSEAQVAGTTRYRLNIGPMASSDVANNLCQSLIAAGERDCLVHRQ
jgi:SPOR domain